MDKEDVFTIQEAADMLHLGYHCVRLRMLKMGLGTIVNKKFIYLNKEEIDKIEKYVDKRFKYR
jgi:hypothetical protein